MSKQQASLRSRQRDNRHSDEFSQSTSPICLPVAESITPPRSVDHFDSSNSSELLRLAQIGILNKRSSNPVLSDPSLKEALSQTIDSDEFLGEVTAVALALDEELGTSKSLFIATKIQNLPTYKKKDPKAEHANQVIKVFEFWSSIKKAMQLRKKSTRIHQFTAVERKMKGIVTIMGLVNAEAEQEVYCLEEQDKILKPVKVSETEWKRPYMKGRNAVPPPNRYELCVFCKHPYIDIPPVNHQHVQKAKKDMEEYKRVSKHIRDFQNRDRTDPPKDEKGIVIKSIKPPKIEKTIIRCHCFQMQRAMPGSNCQSTCPILCVNQDTQESYEPGECPICACKCARVYYMEKVWEISTQLQKGVAKVPTPVDMAKEWMRNAHDSGVLARKATEMAFLGEGTQEESQLRYFEDIQSHNKGMTLVKKIPTVPAAAYLTDTIYNKVMPDPKKSGLIYLDGTEIDLRTKNPSEKASTSRARNNGLKPMPKNVEVTVIDHDDEPPTKVKVSKVAVDEESNAKIQRMQKKLGKYMHGTKRQKHLSEEEKEEKAAAIKVNNLYSEVIKEGCAAGKLTTIKNSLEADNVMGDGEFNSQKYNDCFMNIYGFDE